MSQDGCSILLKSIRELFLSITKHYKLFVMKADVLYLIKQINDSNMHIVCLKTLLDLMVSETDEYVVCKTTINSHYGYKLYLDERYQDPAMHVDNLIGRSTEYLMQS